MTGLLDSGSQITVLGKDCTKIINKLNLKRKPIVALIKTADNSEHCVNHYVDMQYTLLGVTKTVKTLLCPSLSVRLVLGYDFWQIFDIKPTVCQVTYLAQEVNLSSERDESELNNRHILTTIQDKSLKQAINKFEFATENKIGLTTLIKHEIRTPSIAPSEGIRVSPYRISPHLQSQIDKDIDHMLRLGVISKCKSSPWCLPILTVPKKDGSIRVCLDGRRLNKVTERDSYPLPFINRILSNLKGGKYFSKIDLTSAFWQIEVDESSKNKLAFAVPNRGLFRFERMPFGIVNAPMTLTRLMDQVLGFDLEPEVFVYLDDIIIVSDTFERHLELLIEIAKRFNEAGLMISAEKSIFCLKSVEFCGFIIDENGRTPNKSKIKPILSYPEPTTKKELKRFLGMCNWFSNHIPDMQGKLAPLNDLLKGPYKKNQPVKFNDQARAAFEVIKKAMLSPQILSTPNYNEPFYIETDASLRSCGAVVFQLINDQKKVIEYWSQKLSRAEMNYSAVERELLAIVLAVEKFRCYIEGTEFTIFCDNSALQFLDRIKSPSNRLARWALRLQPFKFNVVHKSGKDNELADALSRICCALLLEEPEPKYLELCEKVQSEPDNFPNMKVIDGVLFKNCVDKNEYNIEENQWKVYVPDMSKIRILRESHDSAGHFGITKTVKRIKRNYFWPTLYKDVKEYVNKCEVCKASKSPNFNTAQTMGKKKEASRNFEMIMADFMGPFPRSHNGHQNLLVIVDYFSKFVIMKPTRTQKAKELCRFVEDEIFLKFGVPKTFLSDNGKAFISHEFKSLLSRYHVKQQLIASYTPMVNNTERVNRVIGDTLRASIDQDHKQWDKNVPYIQWALNTAVHDSTKYSPYFTVFLQRNKISGLDYDIEDKSGSNKDLDDDDLIENRAKEFKHVAEVIQSNLNDAYSKSKSKYDLRKRNVKFDVGDTVFRRNFVKSDKTKNIMRKFCPRFIKCKVSKVKGQNVYELADYYTSKILGDFHVKDMIKG